jgi:hypothetical protein
MDVKLEKEHHHVNFVKFEYHSGTTARGKDRRAVFRADGDLIKKKGFDFTDVKPYLPGTENHPRCVT